MLRELVLFCEQHGDGERIARALAALSDAYPGMVAAARSCGGFAAMRWYPVEMLHLVIDTVAAERSADDVTQLAQRAAKVITEHQLSGVYRFLFSTFATPELYARHANRLWAAHYDNGQVQVDYEPREGQNSVAHVRVVRWLGHHHFTCAMNSAAAITIYETMGCKAVCCERIACISQGAPDCEYLVRWSSDDAA